jgi:hypothetical protein
MLDHAFGPVREDTGGFRIPLRGTTMSGVTVEIRRVEEDELGGWVISSFMPRQPWETGGSRDVATVGPVREDTRRWHQRCVRR